MSKVDMDSDSGIMSDHGFFVQGQREGQLSKDVFQGLDDDFIWAGMGPGFAGGDLYFYKQRPKLIKKLNVGGADGYLTEGDIVIRKMPDGMRGLTGEDTLMARLSNVGYSEWLANNPNDSEDDYRDHNYFRVVPSEKGGEDLDVNNHKYFIDGQQVSPYKFICEAEKNGHSYERWTGFGGQALGGDKQVRFMQAKPGPLILEAIRMLKEDYQDVLLQNSPGQIALLTHNAEQSLRVAHALLKLADRIDGRDLHTIEPFKTVAEKMAELA